MRASAPVLSPTFSMPPAFVLAILLQRLRRCHEVSFSDCDERAYWVKHHGICKYISGRSNGQMGGFLLPYSVPGLEFQRLYSVPQAFKSLALLVAIPELRDSCYR